MLGLCNMQVFAIFDVARPELVKRELEKSYPDNHYHSGSGTFFVSATGLTTQQIGESIGVGEPQRSGDRIIIVPVTAYWDFIRVNYGSGLK